MLAAGLTVEQALIAVEAMEQAKDGGQSSAARRQAAYRARQKAKAVTRDVTSITNVTTVTDASPLNDVEPNLVTVEVSLNPPPPYSPPAPKKSERQDVLSAFDGMLTPDRAEAVVAHRSKLRKPLTVHAARLLAKQFAKAGDPNEAADTMIARGWQGYEPAWANGQRQNGPPGGSRKGTGFLDGLAELERIFPDERPSYPRLAG